MAKQSDIGDIYEIKTPGGLAYFQYIYKNELSLELIRLLPGVYNKAPSSFQELAKSKELYYIYFPVSAAKSKGIVNLVSNEPIPAWARKPPTMRKLGFINGEGRTLNWLISDASGTKNVKELNNEQKHLSIDAIWNDTMLVERICSGWLPEEDI